MKFKCVVCKTQYAADDPAIQRGRPQWFCPCTGVLQLSVSAYAHKLYLAITNRTPMRLDELSALPFGLQPDDLPWLFDAIGQAYLAALAPRPEDTLGVILANYAPNPE